MAISMYLLYLGARKLEVLKRDDIIKGSGGLIQVVKTALKNTFNI